MYLRLTFKLYGEFINFKVKIDYSLRSKYTSDLYYLLQQLQFNKLYCIYIERKII